MSETIQSGPCRCCARRVSSEAPSCPHCGQPFPFALPDDGFAEARAQLKKGNKITAIKLVREKNGMGLADAKNLVESWE
jgi:predicted amidophosphoribosyltransferase